jgi:eukaryotic-like serine/threonine-protein kinase
MQIDETGARRKCEAYLFDCFEASLKRGDLLQRGERLRVQDLPFKMLVALLERPGELVSKEELAQQLWGQEIYTDIDQSLYVLAKKLRRVLGDDANHPRYIKTVSGRGYKFIESVTPVFTPAAELIPLLHPPPMQAGPTDYFPQSRTAPRSSRTSMRGLMLASVIITLVAAGVAISLYRYEHRSLMNDQDKVVVATFANNTGNADLDQALSSALESQLQESPYLNIVPDQRYRAVVKSSASPSIEDELHACVSLDGRVLLKGGISVAGLGYQFALQAWRCADAKLLTTEKADASSQDSILSALDLVTNHMRRRLGEPEESLKKFSVPAIQATTASLAALKAFNYGDEMRFKSDPNAAIASFKLAIDLDPQFALAYARLGTSYHNIGQFVLSRQFYQRAFELRSSRSSDRERLYIVAHYYEFATGQTQRAIEIYKLWHTLYPRDPTPIDNLAGQYMMVGQPQQTLNLIQQATRLEPENQGHYVLQTQATLRLGDYAALRKRCNGEATKLTDRDDFHRACFEAAFALDDDIAMRRELQRSQGDTLYWVAVADSAWVAMYRGKSSEAAMIFREAERSALQNKSVESAADIELDQAMLEAEVGLLPAARTDARAVLNLPFVSATEQAYAALVLSRAGEERSFAEIAAKKAEEMAPLDDVVNSAMLPTAHAAAFLGQVDPANALIALEPTRAFELYASMQMVPNYYRGLAYLQARKPELAAREFKYVIDHKALLPTFSIYLVLSQLELGHAYQLLGDSKSANSSFARVESAWKDADPGFPPLQRLRQYKRLPTISK